MSGILWRFDDSSDNTAVPGVIGGTAALVSVESNVHAAFFTAQ
jgi:hypothetical protein